MVLIKRKPGQGFFLVLLSVGVVGMIVWWAITFRGRELTVMLFEEQIVRRVVPASLPPDYPPAQREAAVAAMAAFYAAARQGEMSDEAVVTVSRRLQESLADERITSDEVQGLLGLIRQYDRRSRNLPR